MIHYANERFLYRIGVSTYANRFVYERCAEGAKLDTAFARNLKMLGHRDHIK